MRCILPLLLTVLMLECPLNCMGALQLASRSAEASPVKCGCCARHCKDSETPEEQPSVPDDDCDCSNCLCHGAIGKSDQLDVAQLQVLNVACADFVNAEVNAASDLLTPPDGTADTANPPRCGLIARIALQSFQI